jgi:hypothetical protein
MQRQAQRGYLDNGSLKEALEVSGCYCGGIIAIARETNLQQVSGWLAQH